MFLNISKLQVEIALAAVGHHKTLCQNQAALSRRLEISETDAKDQLACNTYLQSVLDKFAASDADTHTLEFEAPMAARAMRVALIQWVSLAITRNKSAHGATLTTDLGARRSAAQNLVDQLSDQLSLPIEDVSALVARAGKKSSATRKGKETPTMGTNDGSQLDLEDDDPTDAVDAKHDAEDADMWDGEGTAVVVDEADEEVAH